MEKNTNLFSPIKLGEMLIPNRIIMAPLTRCRASKDHVPTSMMATYYSQRSTAGLIISEATFISTQGVGYPNAPGIYNSEQINAWKKVTSAVHENGGRIFLQLWHVGRVSHPSYYDGELPVAPSAIASTDGMAATNDGRKPFVTPRALETSELPGIVEQYRLASRNAIQAGFDGVEIHAANGFLLDQFLRSSSNKRTDEYGGSAENRARLALEVVDAVTSECGNSRVGIRISPTGTYNSMSDDNPEETFTYLTKQLNSYNLAYLHIVEAWGGDLRHGAKVLPLSVLRNSYNGTIIVNGGYDKTKGNSVIANDLANAVAYGHLFIANPDLPKRFCLNSELNEQDQDTFYSGGEAGYTDYPFLLEVSSEVSLPEEA